MAMKTRLPLTAYMVVVSFCSLNAQTYGDYRILGDVIGNGGAHNTQIYFDDESWDPQNPPTYGWDACCDANLLQGAPGQPQIFTNVVAPPLPPVNQKLSVNALPLLFEPTNVPFGFTPPATAEYNFSFTHLYSLPVGTTVELEDLSLNVTQDLMMDSSYTTWGAPSDDENRFIIHINPSTIIGVNERTSKPNIKWRLENGMLAVSGLDEMMAKTIKLYDLQGRLLIDERVSEKTDYQSLDISRLSTGVFVLAVESSTGDRITRKVSF